MKHFAQARKIVTEVVKRKPKARWFFLTLTVKNSYDGTELKESLRSLAQGFRRMMGYKKVKQNFIGFMRITKVTVNKIDNSYSQHLHVLLCVENTYFKNTENYITQKQWMAFWKRAMKLDYDPIVDIRAIKPKNEHNTNIESIDETSKYPFKDIDEMTGNQERNLQIVKDLEEGLYRKRLVSYGGLLKKVHNEFRLNIVETEDFTDDEEDEAKESAYMIIGLWYRGCRNYFIKE